MPNKAPKRSFAKTINPFFVQPQSEAQTVQSLRKRLESRVIREMAGESVRKKSSKPAERRGIYHYAVLRKVPAGEFKGNQKSGYGGDKVITDFFIKNAHASPNWDRFARACAAETKIPWQIVDCRVKTLKEAGWISEINPAKCGGTTKSASTSKKVSVNKMTPTEVAQKLADRARIAKSPFKGYGNQALIQEYFDRRKKTDPQSVREMEEIKLVFAMQNAGSKKVFPY